MNYKNKKQQIDDLLMTQSGNVKKAKFKQRGGTQILKIKGRDEFGRKFKIKEKGQGIINPAKLKVDESAGIKKAKFKQMASGDKYKMKTNKKPITGNSSIVYSKPLTTYEEIYTVKKKPRKTNTPRYA